MIGLRRGIAFCTAALVAVLFCGPGWAQSVIMSGPAVGGRAPMFQSGPGQGFAALMDSGPASGGVLGQGLSELLMQATNPHGGTAIAPSSGKGPYGTHNCMWDTYATNAAGAHYLCFDADAQGGALIAVGAVGVAVQQPVNCLVNGVLVANCLTQTGQVPCNPNVQGAVPATGGGTNNILRADCTFTNSLVAAQNAAITTTGAALTGATSASASADLIESYVFCTAPGTAASCGGGNFDGVVGIGINNPGTTTLLVSGVSGYALANQPFSGAGPSSVALFGAGAVNVDGGRVWGLNVNISDRQYRVAQPSGSHNRYLNGGEFDVSASYPDTNVTGAFVAGNSVVQPANSTGFAVLGQDFSANIPGSIARWTQAFYTYPGVAIHFANIGTQLPVPSPIGTYTSDSQDIIMGAYIGGVGFQGLFYFGEAHPNFGSMVQPSFNMNYPLQVWTGGMSARSATDQIVQLGGKNTLTSGASIESRNDAGSLVEPLEILATNLLFNSNTIQVNNGGGLTNAFTGSCTGGAFHTINGIVVSCP